MKTTLLAVLFLILGFLIYPATTAVQPICQTAWEGRIDAEFATRAKRDLAQAAGCDIVRIDLFSPGGGVFDAISVVEAIEQAKQSGLRVEIRGHTLVASGATLVLGAGSAGLRVVRKGTIVIVHGPRTLSWEGPVCFSRVDQPTTDDEKVANAIIDRMATIYANESGKTTQETLKWLACDNTQVGDAGLLVTLGLADRVE